MIFTNPLKAFLIKREKRFLLHVRLENGTEITAHCPNSGAMHGVLQEGNPVLLTHADNPKRKLSYTAQLIYAQDTWIGINTHLTNTLVQEALTQLFPSITSFKTEVPYGEKSRIDFVLYEKENPHYVEVKNVHMVRMKGVAEFPDAPTLRGQKHLKELTLLAQKGVKSSVIYVIQRNDIEIFKIAEDIDPVYARLSHEAIQAGVEMKVCICDVSPKGVSMRPTFL